MSNKQVTKDFMAASPHYITGVVRGIIKVPCRLNVALIKDVSGSLKLTSGGKTVNVYINDYRMLFRFLKLKGEIQEIVVTGPLSVKAFIDAAGKKAGASTRVQAESILVFVVNGDVLKKVNLFKEENHVGQETCKYFLMRQAYQFFEKEDRVITGKCPPDNLYEELTKIHTKLCFEQEQGKDTKKELVPNIEKRSVEKTLQDYIVRSNKFTIEFVEAGENKKLELLDDDNIGDIEMGVYSISFMNDLESMISASVSKSQRNIDKNA
ncbi:hypothetical protein BD770DRAFT_416289 [Pilaira anomala]|nr:hypothetical protein BD770DRAFT_416289 [Pilaira anomala]